MKLESENEVAQSCPTPSHRMDCSLPGSSVHGIFQARVLELGDIAYEKYSSTVQQLAYRGTFTSLKVHNLKVSM